jgi:parallel beta-helix repeat protein
MKNASKEGMDGRRLVALCAILVGMATLLLVPGSASATVTCSLVASPAGADSNPGTVDQPVKSVQHLIDSLAPGQTGCLRSGAYADSDQEIKFETPSTTLTSYPGERATVKGRVWVAQTAHATTIADLDIDGRNDRTLPSPTINADDVVLRGNDITNFHTSICVSVGSPHTWGRAHRTLIEGNRVHNCGLLPATNYDHGIYVSAADDTTIRDNLIYDNADRGIQLYDDAQRTVITGNIVDGNGQGIIFGGSEEAASSNNVVEHNVITNSKLRDNVESSWGGPVGSGNVVRSNCVGGGAYDEGDGGILKDEKAGFSTVGNILEAPTYANPDAGDFTIDPSSPCAAMVAGATRAQAQGAADTPEVTITASKRKVKRMKRVRIRGNAPGAGSVTVLALNSGEWKPVQRVAANAQGKYGARIQIRTSGRAVLKAVAGGLRDSRPVKLRVKA